MSLNKAVVGTLDGSNLLDNVYLRGDCLDKPPRGCVLYLPFSYTAKDFSGEGNDGTIYGATWTDSEFGKALSFDNDYVEVPDSDSLDVNYITIEAWIRPNDVSDIRTIMDKGEDQTDGSYVFRIRGTEQKMELYLYNSAGSVGSCFGDTVLSPNTWYHVVATFDGTEIKHYLNGEEDGSCPFSGSIRIGAQPIWIGMYKKGASRAFKGLIGVIRVYRFAFSESEIQALCKRSGYYA